MSDKGFEEADKMSEAYVSEAREMSEFIVRTAHRGPGDTVDAAMHRAEQIFGVPYAWLHRLRYRRDLRDMPVSVFGAIAHAYRSAGAHSQRAYEEERRKHEPNSKLVRLADLVAGPPMQGRD